GCSLDLKIIAVYIDHRLRPEETPRENTMVAHMARKLHIDYESVTVDALAHKKEHGTSLEESCRLLRYQKLEKCRQKHEAEVIAVAHTAEDQVEEMFLRLMRGTGLKGLSGMRLRRDKIVRPLLFAAKKELVDYLHSKAIPYCIDSSNTDTAFLRNRLRLEILPSLRNHFNPALTSTLNQTADILAQDDDLLDQLTLAAMKKCCAVTPAEGSIAGKLELDLTSFTREHLALRRRILEKILWHFGVKANFGHISRILTFAGKSAGGKQMHLPLGLRMYSSHSQLIFAQPWGERPFRGSYDRVRPSITLGECGDYDISEYGARLQLQELVSPPERWEGGELVVDAAKISFPIVLRPARPGERISPPGLNGSKKVARYLADVKIPRHDRASYPLVTAGNLIVAVAGLQIDQHFAISDNTERFLLVSWQRQNTG
ncbi:MAG TPA: tRNA lysidine(34) synthetase TilS, partial [Desulfopila sp.]|nr:tRNA lysidine(34) synthetase TilS [Desulfopila sp.]